MAMKRGEAWLTVVLGALISCIGCGQSGTSTAGGEVPQIDTTNLLAECEQLAQEGAKQNKDTWMADDPLPPTIKSLSPQYVQLLTRSSATIVDIQMSGGFRHHGYLVVCESKDPGYTPHKGRNWKITRVAPRVFEYRE